MIRYDDNHDYGLVKISDTQYQKCSDHCCNAKIGKRKCFCWTCRKNRSQEQE